MNKSTKISNKNMNMQNMEIVSIYLAHFLNESMKSQYICFVLLDVTFVACQESNECGPLVKPCLDPIPLYYFSQTSTQPNAFVMESASPNVIYRT